MVAPAPRASETGSHDQQEGFRPYRGGEINLLTYAFAVLHSAEECYDSTVLDCIPQQYLWQDQEDLENLDVHISGKPDQDDSSGKRSPVGDQKT
jgi:hypothetical protein